jgi:hypothetical protein
MRVRYVTIFALVVLVATCARARGPGFPPSARSVILVPTDFTSTFVGLYNLLEVRGLPVLMADSAFGSIRTDWVYWEPGEMNLATMAVCEQVVDSLPMRARARFAFEIRRRANRASVAILTHWQSERLPGFDDSTRGFQDCRSTGEWERAIEQVLTQGATIR